MLVYNEEGFLHNEQATAVTQELANKVNQLFEDLFAQGMTLLEARALIGHVQSGVDYAATLCLMYHQCHESELNE